MYDRSRRELGNHFVESLKTFLSTSGDVLLSYNIAVKHSLWVPAFADVIRVELLFIPLYAP
jgi:hypothetical protein